jgi:hypothetical protein
MLGAEICVVAAVVVFSRMVSCRLYQRNTQRLILHMPDDPS